jgi:hypothetical protein
MAKKETAAKAAPKTTEKTELKDEAEVKSMSATMLKYRKKYEPSLSASGRKSLNTGDEIAHLLAGLEPRLVIAAAERLLSLKTNELWDKYSGLNVGQQRMNAGNRIRGAVKRGDVTVKDVKKAIKGQ